MRVSSVEAKRVDVTPQRVIETAASLFRERGYAATTTRELSQRLGIQKASLYYHFAKKEELLYRICVDALSRAHATVSAALTNETDPLRRIDVMVRSHVEAMLRDLDMNATMLLELDALSGQRRKEVIRLRDRYEQLVLKEIRDAQRARVLRVDIEARHLVLAMLNLLNWSIVWYRENGSLSRHKLAGVLSTVFIEGAASRSVRAPRARGRRIRRNARP